MEVGRRWQLMIFIRHVSYSKIWLLGILALAAHPSASHCLDAGPKYPAMNSYCSNLDTRKSLLQAVPVGHLDGSSLTNLFAVLWVEVLGATSRFYLASVRLGQQCLKDGSEEPYSCFYPLNCWSFESWRRADLYQAI